MKRCQHKGCVKPLKAKGYCSGHWRQFHEYGYIKDRTRLSNNDYDFIGVNIAIILRDTHGIEKSRCVVSIEDLPLIKGYKWYENSNGYAMSRVNKKEQIFLHRLIINPPKEMYVDHIDGNPLNNKRENLRVCTHQQNIMNQKLRVDNKSGIKGVAWDERREMWRARIHANGKDNHLGYFTNREEAKKSRLAAELKYFGEYSRQSKEMELV